MTRHRFLVAIEVDSNGEDYAGRGQCERWLHGQLNRSTFRRAYQTAITPSESGSVGGAGVWEPSSGGPAVSDWWVAEDDRHDRSREPSAVLLPSGMTQEQARSLLGVEPEVEVVDVINVEASDWEDALMEPLRFTMGSDGIIRLTQGPPEG